MSALRGRHEKFCQEYAIDYNGTQAAIRAGYEKQSARQQASRLLSQEDILNRIMELQAEQGIAPASLRICPRAAD